MCSEAKKVKKVLYYLRGPRVWRLRRKKKGRRLVWST